MPHISNRASCRILLHNTYRIPRMSRIRHLRKRLFFSIPFVRVCVCVFTRKEKRTLRTVFPMDHVDLLVFVVVKRFTKKKKKPHKENTNVVLFFLNNTCFSHNNFVFLFYSIYLLLFYFFFFETFTRKTKCNSTRG